MAWMTVNFFYSYNLREISSTLLLFSATISLEIEQRTSSSRSPISLKLQLSISTRTIEKKSILAN